MREKGFTLIELVTAISITMILTLIVLANYKAGDRNSRVQLAADTVITAITDAQNASLTGKQSVGCSNQKPFALRFVKNSFSIIFACDFNSPIQTYTLPANTRIKSLTLDSISMDSLQIYYTPPFGAIKTDCVSCNSPYTSFTQAQIILEFTNAPAGTRIWTVRIDGLSGKIDATRSN